MALPPPGTRFGRGSAAAAAQITPAEVQTAASSPADLQLSKIDQQIASLTSNEGKGILGVGGLDAKLLEQLRLRRAELLKKLEQERALERVAESSVGLQERLGETVGEATEQRRQALERGLESRERQNQAWQQLLMAALGQVPSAAEKQQKFGQEQALQQQNALANRGVGAPALAGRQAALAGARLQSNVLGQAATLRAQEQAVARQALAQAIQGQRGQDLQEAGLGTSLQVPTQGQLGASVGNLGSLLTGLRGQDIQSSQFDRSLAFQEDQADLNNLLRLIGIATGGISGLAGPALA